jgi:2-keto-4-pentenoate hydratase
VVGEGLRLADALVVATARRSRIALATQQISIDDAYAVQEEVFRRRQLPVAAWKLALTTKASQSAMGVAGPAVGRLATPDIKIGPSAVETAAGPLYAEAELAIVLKQDLPARAQPYDGGEVAAAIGDVYAAIELCTSRFKDDDVSVSLLVADNSFAHALVLGDKLSANWDPRFATAGVVLRRTGSPLVHGSTSAVLGNPLHAMVWLANWLSSRGEGLQRGQVVATGSCTGLVQVSAGDQLQASFANIGEATVSISPRGAAGVIYDYQAWHCR